MKASLWSLFLILLSSGTILHHYRKNKQTKKKKLFRSRVNSKLSPLFTISCDMLTAKSDAVLDHPYALGGRTGKWKQRPVVHLSPQNPEEPSVRRQRLSWHHEKEPFLELQDFNVTPLKRGVEQKKYYGLNTLVEGFSSRKGNFKLVTNTQINLGDVMFLWIHVVFGEDF